MVNDEFDNMDIHFMKLAIGQAKKAAKINEVPIGCVIVYDGKIIGRGYNRRNTDKTTLGHTVCNIRALPDVCRRYYSSKNSTCSYRFNEF